MVPHPSQKYFRSECIEIKATDCPPKIPPLIHFWASRSYQSQNSLCYTLKYSQLTHRVKSTKTELLGKSTCSVRLIRSSWNRFYTQCQFIADFTLKPWLIVSLQYVMSKKSTTFKLNFLHRKVMLTFDVKHRFCNIMSKPQHRFKGCEFCFAMYWS